MDQQSLRTEGVLRRAWRDAQFWSTSTVISLLWLGAWGTAGGLYARSLDADDQGLMAIVTPTVGTIVGIFLGFAIALTVRLSLTLRIQRDEARSYALAETERLENRHQQHEQDLQSTIQQLTAQLMDRAAIQEQTRRVQLRDVLVREFLFSNNGITPQEAAGIITPRIKHFVNGQLRARGEPWQI